MKFQANAPQPQFKKKKKKKKKELEEEKKFPLCVFFLSFIIQPLGGICLKPALMYSGHQSLT